MPEFALIDGIPGRALPLSDRGFAYGDGVFETLRSFERRLPLWPEHVARLAEGCRRLGLPQPDAQLLASECDQALADAPSAVLKLVLTRGDGGRGYAPPLPTHARRVLMRFPLPPQTAPARGLALIWCTTVLPRDPRLAGIKHLNRLHQVLARAEVDAAGADEGLCCDDHGNVVCATAANLFARIDGVLCTPAVSECGVAGVARAALLADAAFGRTIRIGAVARADLARAEEVFLTNAVRGIIPVRHLAGRTLSSATATAAASTVLERRGFAAALA